jgi:hypothetical protein
MTFLSPWFLLGTFLAVIPVLIHLWYRHRLKRIEFSSLRFLRKTEARRFGWLRLREWLILALRCMFIIFLFSALARPQLKRNLFRTGKLASVCLIIDNSYSMSYGENFDKMKGLVQQVIARYSPRSEFCLVTLCGDEDEESFWMTKTSMLAALNNVRLAFAGGSIGTAMMRAPVNQARHDVDYLYFGDGQSHNFKDFPSAGNKGKPFYWFRIPAGGNIVISHVNTKDPLAVAADEYELRATLKSYSAHNWSGKIGIASGDYYIEKECVVPSGAELEVDFVLPVEFLSGSVEIFDDSLLLDNTCYFAKSLLRSINILLVGENPYVANALGSGHSSSVRFNVDNSARIGTMDLRRYNLVILNDMQEISEAERIRLADHVNSPGAALIMILGNDIGENSRSILSDWCRFERKVVPRGYVTVDWVDREHPVFMIFGPGRAFGDVQYFQYVKVIAEQGVLARFGGGDPFIVVKDNMCVITGALHARSTNFVFKNAFVPFLLRMVINLISDQYRKEFYVGDEFMEYSSIRAPNGELLSRGDVYFMPGFHIADKETLCVNVDPIEGDLRVIGNERAGILGVQQVDPERHLTGSDLTNLLLVVALVMLAFEVGLLLLR